MTEPAQGQDAFTNAVAGDRAAFAELVRKHQAMVLASRCIRYGIGRSRRSWLRRFFSISSIT